MGIYVAFITFYAALCRTEDLVGGIAKGSAVVILVVTSNASGSLL